MKNSLIVFLVLGLFAFAGCSDDSNVEPMGPANDAPTGEEQFPVNEDMPGVETEFALQRTASGDIVDTAVAAGFETLVAAVQAAELEGALRSDGPFTVFAPTDEAFADLPAGLLDALLLPENQDKLQQILLYHVLEGQVNSGDLRFFQRVETLEGSDVEILRFFRLILVNGVWVQLADVQATNGVIHVIDEVLIPEGFTLEDPAEPTDDLVDTAVDAGLSTLVTAVQAAGLEETLRSEGPFTVFAPSNDAFDRLPDGLVAELLEPENVEFLQDLLLYHVVSGAEVLSTDLNRFQRVEMAQGDKTFVFKSRFGIFVNFSRVVAADVLASNGVAHVINRVLIPPHFYGYFESLPDQVPEMNMQVQEQLAGVN
ncbi:MAG TPA: fasciclin domain-containing protein [Candidatus Krumholzibacteria bacterium]|nr:fasciclin domain-containing protein [Candidatus Krumholzibacteria bacterium]